MVKLREEGTPQEIHELIKERGRMSLGEIRSVTTINYNTIRGVVIRLTNEGLIERVGRGVYRTKKP